MLEIIFVLVSMLGGMKLQPGEVIIPGKHPAVIVTYPQAPARPQADAIVTNYDNGK